MGRSRDKGRSKCLLGLRKILSGRERSNFEHTLSLVVWCVWFLCGSVISHYRTAVGSVISDIVPAIFFRCHENFEKSSLGHRDRFRQKIVKIGVSSQFLSSLKFWKFTCHFLANFADRPRIYIETLYESNFPQDVFKNSSKRGGQHCKASWGARTWYDGMLVWR